MTTPMMQQYREAKESHPGMLVLFRAGDPITEERDARLSKGGSDMHRHTRIADDQLRTGKAAEGLT